VSRLTDARGGACEGLLHAGIGLGLGRRRKLRRAKDARHLIGEMLRCGRAAAPGWEMEGGRLPLEAVELAWLGAALG